ncbi:hypothetical protein PanWU01x14_135590 [Parasponia andersonii]|uniref:DUF4378 domain-containing protein n=1 Tax=Parasponia andersonii TaxID=3476 RepID=A0A2P5CPB2_PARAD|nr:hypothetical protein PanWU01x14_135590 [Parasponia andersonii]
MARLTPPKSPLVCDKNHSGCMWSLYSLFEFRQGNSRRKLISDRKRLNREVVDDEKVKQHGLLTKFDEKFQGRDDRNENLVGPDMPNDEKLKEEEASSSEKQMNNKATSDIKLKQPNSGPGQLPRNHGKSAETCQRPCHAPLHDRTGSAKQKQPPHRNLVAKTSGKLESREALGKKARLRKRRGCGCKNVDFVNYDQLNKINPQLLKVNDEAIVNQKFIEGKYLSRGGINQQSKQLMEALQISNSNKELFTKLLQDPNSLLVKHTQDLRDSQAQKEQKKSSSEAKTLDHQTCNEKQHEEHASTRELIASDKSQSEGRSDPQCSDTIIVLKPGLTSMQDSGDKISHCSSSQYCHDLEKHVQSVRPAYFSFDHIKRKFRHAMGVTRKEQRLMSIDGVKHQSSGISQGTEDGKKGKGMEIIKRNFENIVHGEIEESSFDVKKRDKLGKLNEFKPSIGHETASSSGSGYKNSSFSSLAHPNKSESRTHVEGRRHYFEILNNKNEDINFFQKQVPKVLWSTISSPEYDLLPVQSPRRDIKTSIVTAQMRFYPYSNSQVAYENSWSVQEELKGSYSSLLNQNTDSATDSKKTNSKFQDVDTKQYISDNLSSRAKVLEVDSVTRGETNPVEFPSRLDGIEKNDTLEATDTRHSEETVSSGMLSESDSSDEVSTSEISDGTGQESNNLLGAPPELCNTDNNTANQNTDTTNANEENECYRCSRLDLPFEDQPSTCSTDVLLSTPTSIGRVQEYPDSIKDRGDQSSPISVLERFFADVASPPSTVSQPASSLVRFHLDTDINITTSSYLYGSISEYVKAVLQASGLNWDELDLKCRASDPMLDSCLLDSSKLRSNQLCGDCKLLFDFISEVLLEVYDSHFRCSPGVSFIKPNYVHSLIPVENFVIQEVMKRVDWHFQPHSSPRTMERLITEDLKRSRTWLDIRIDVEDIATEMVEDALEELLMETIVGMHS